VITSSYSSLTELIKDEVFKEAAKNRIHAVHFRYDMEDSIADENSSYSFYVLTLEKGNPIVVFNRLSLLSFYLIYLFIYLFSSLNRLIVLIV
jgi:hypothetical protein